MVSTTRPDLAEILESDVLNTGISDEDQRSLARALAFAAHLYGEKLLGTGEPAYEHAVGTARKAAELSSTPTRVPPRFFSPYPPISPRPKKS